MSRLHEWESGTPPHIQAAWQLLSESQREEVQAWFTQPRTSSPSLAHIVGKRTVLGKSCLTCGGFRPGDDFAKRKDGRIAPRCRYCESKRQRPPDVLQRQRQRNKQRVDALRDTATRGGYLWTGPELELLERTDLTLSQMATMLGRTYSAVAGMRSRMNTDPALRAFGVVAGSVS